MIPITIWSHMLLSHVTQLYDTEKIMESSKIDNIIQYNNNILVL